MISSCTSEIEDRIPAFQATINGVQYWEATNFNVSTNALGEVVIVGNDFNSSISLKFPSTNIGVYDFRDNIIGEATYSNVNQYSTLNDGVGSIAYFSDGEISINEISSDSKITGTFTFNAYDSSGELTVNVSQGIFYRLPITQTAD
jgi:hypothetical protein|tara:strand:- start:565 stop:1002 length:438 start_codon:yes stop_codon:yes gene_type:complete